MALTPKQEKFCLEYLVDCCAAKAARRAGYEDNSAKEQGYQLLQNEAVQEKIAELRRDQTKRTLVNVDDVLIRLDQMGTFDIGEIFTEKNVLRPINEIPPEIRLCISSLEIFEVEEWDNETKQKVKIGETVKIKFFDKLKANELIGRHRKMFTDKVEHSVGGTLEQLVAGSLNPSSPKQVSPPEEKPKLEKKKRKPKK
jgi:phage terminase small subunit